MLLLVGLFGVKRSRVVSKKAGKNPKVEKTRKKEEEKEMRMKNDMVVAARVGRPQPYI